MDEDFVGSRLVLSADVHGNPEELVEVVRRRRDRSRGATSGAFEYRVRYLDGANKGELMWETESELAKAKRPCRSAAVVETVAKKGTEPAIPDGLSAYERKRLAKIARNEAKLASLGLSQSKASFTPPAVVKPHLSAIALRAKKGVDAARRKRKREARASAPRRTSRRLKGEQTEGFELPRDFRGLPHGGPGRQRVHQQLVSMGQRPGGRNPGERWNARALVVADGFAVASDRHDRQRVAVAEDGAPLFGNSFVGHLITAFEAEKKAKAGSRSSAPSSSAGGVGISADEDNSEAEKKTLRCVAQPRCAAAPHSRLPQASPARRRPRLTTRPTPVSLCLRLPRAAPPTHDQIRSAAREARRAE
jgi:hypothetical protein